MNAPTNIRSTPALPVDYMDGSGQMGRVIDQLAPRPTSDAIGALNRDAHRAYDAHRQAAESRVHVIEVEWNEDSALIERAAQHIADAARCIAELTRNSISGSIGPEKPDYLARCMSESIEFSLINEAAVRLDAEVQARVAANQAGGV